MARWMFVEKSDENIMNEKVKKRSLPKKLHLFINLAAFHLGSQ